MSSLQAFLNNSYVKKDKQQKEIGGYIRDDSLSGNRAQVYHNPSSNNTVVAHTGTNSLIDWLTDLEYANGRLEKTKRYAHASKIQREAEDKYGKENVVTVGSSLGGKMSEKVGQNSKHIYTLNAPVLPNEIFTPRDNQTAIRSSGDWISLLSPFQRAENKITIPFESLNPIKEHSSDILDRLDNQIVFE